MDDQLGSCYVRTAVMENKFDRRRGGRLRRKWQEPRRCFDRGIPNVNSSALVEDFFLGLFVEACAIACFRSRQLPRVPGVCVETKPLSVPR
ncbi:Putative protein of unknown function [Podospora comata]|uniref:Uncharacterized protein n=1 Tax=Podospora comata TaxID=48703 RepID=A0ABY6SKK6_PODCO|nr:Putative protein of unknown function [Podospora comata]